MNRIAAICVLLIVSSLYPSVVRGDYLSTLESFGGLISHWGLEELSGSTVVDSVTDDIVDGNNPGTVSGSGVTMDVPGPRPSDGFFGFSPSNNAIDFGGDITQRLLMDPSGYTGVSGLTEATLSMWFRITSTNNQHYHLGGLESSTLDASGRYSMVINHYDDIKGLRGFGRVDQAPNEIQLSTPNGATSVYTDSTWHHAALTFQQVGENRELKLYVDGTFQGMDTQPAQASDALALRDALSFGYDVGTNAGSSGGARAMIGQLDEIAFHDHALLPGDISTLYQSALDNSLSADPNLPTIGLSAHRGAQQTHPENTMAAFEEAVTLGAHQIEMDVRMTLDGELVIMHDETVDRTTNGTGAVANMTLAQIKTLDAGSWKSAQFAGEQVPTFAEVLEAMPLNVWLNVHTKGDYALGYAVAQEIAAHGRLHQAFVSAEDDGAAGARAAVPDILINNLNRQSGDTSLYVNETIANGDDFLQLLNTLATPAEMDALKDAGVQINYCCTDYPSDADDPTDLAGLLNAGVDFVLVNELGPMMSQAMLLGIEPMQPIYRGDFNQDGFLDESDVGPFVQALANRAAFQAENPNFDVDLYGDFDHNGRLDFGDLGGFQAAVTATAGASAKSIPEPSTFSLFAFAALSFARLLRPKRVTYP